MAQQAMEQNDYRRALDLYEQALDIAPYVQQAYLQKAVVLEHMGQSRRAEMTLQQGMMQAQRAATGHVYKQRLSALKRDSHTAFFD